MATRVQNREVVGRTRSSFEGASESGCTARSPACGQPADRGKTISMVPVESGGPRSRYRGRHRRNSLFGSRLLPRWIWFEAFSALSLANIRDDPNHIVFREARDGRHVTEVPVMSLHAVEDCTQVVQIGVMSRLVDN